MQLPGRIWLRGSEVTMQIIHASESTCLLDQLDHDSAESALICTAWKAVDITFVTSMRFPGIGILCDEATGHAFIEKDQVAAVF